MSLSPWINVFLCLCIVFLPLTLVRNDVDPQSHVHMKCSEVLILSVYNGCAILFRRVFHWAYFCLCLLVGHAMSPHPFDQLSCQKGKCLRQFCISAMLRRRWNEKSGCQSVSYWATANVTNWAVLASLTMQWSSSLHQLKSISRRYLEKRHLLRHFGGLRLKGGGASINFNLLHWERWNRMKLLGFLK